MAADPVDPIVVLLAALFSLAVAKTIWAGLDLWHLIEECKLREARRHKLEFIDKAFGTKLTVGRGEVDLHRQLEVPVPGCICDWCALRWPMGWRAHSRGRWMGCLCRNCWYGDRFPEYVAPRELGPAVTPPCTCAYCWPRFGPDVTPPANPVQFITMKPPPMRRDQRADEWADERFDEEYDGRV